MTYNPNDMASVLSAIQQMQVQNGLRQVSPLGQGYYPMDNTPAPPGYRLNQLQDAYQRVAMSDDPRKKSINPLAGTEGIRGETGSGGMGGGEMKYGFAVKSPGAVRSAGAFEERMAHIALSDAGGDIEKAVGIIRNAGKGSWNLDPKDQDVIEKIIRGK